MANAKKHYARESISIPPRQGYVTFLEFSFFRSVDGGNDVGLSEKFNLIQDSPSLENIKQIFGKTKIASYGNFQLLIITRLSVANC